MTDFANQYAPPGVYIQEQPSTLVSVVGTSPAVVGIIGPSVGYLLHAENVTLTGTGAVMLSKLGIDPSSVIVRLQDGTVVAGSGYTLTAGAGADADLGETEDNTLTIARNGTTITDGSTVYVTYRYTDADYTQPHRFRDYDDVKEFYGEPIDPTTGAITSPLSFAAKFAFDNLAREVVLVATAGVATATTRAELSDAYAKLSTFFDVNIVVELPVGITGTTLAPGDVINVGTDLKAGIVASESDRMPRVAFIGYETDVTLEPLTIAAGINHRRVALVWPNGLVYFNGFNNQTMEIPGYYLAAALAGLMASQRVQDPLTRKQVAGFTGIPSSKAASMTVTNKNAWSSGGVLVVETDRNNRLVVRHGVSTDPTNVQTREISLVRAKDQMINTIDATINASNLIGTPIDIETPARVKGVIDGVLNTLKSNGVIVDYQNLKVRQQSIDPTVIEVKFEYMPPYPLNYITVSFTVNVMTGTVAAAA